MRIINYAMILLFVLSSITIYAQEEEEQPMKYIFGSKGGKTKVSGFVAPIMQFSAIGDEFAFLMGGGGAVLLNQTFYIGAFGEGLSTSHYSQIESIPEKGRTRFGYGGFWLGYIHKHQKPVHFGVSTRLGWGSIYYDVNHYKNYDNDYDYQTDPNFLDNVFVIVPQIEAEFNFFKWMKMNVGIGYRVVTGINKEYMETGELIFDKKDFNKPQGTITLMFGYFK